MLKRGNKKGISRLKITVIILVVFILIILIVPVVVKKVFLVGAEDRILGKYKLNLEISGVQVRENNSLLVRVDRGLGKAEFVGINFIVEDEDNKEIIRFNDSLEEMEYKLFLLELKNVNLSKAKKISIDPVFMVGSREESSRNIEDKYIFGSSGLKYLDCMPYCPSGAECGNDGCGGECSGGCVNESYICDIHNKCVFSLETRCSLVDVTIFEVSSVGNSFTVLFSREGGEPIGGVKLIFTNETGNSTFVTDIEGNLPESELIIQYVNISEKYLEKPNNLRTVVYFVDEFGMEEICRPSKRFYL